MGDFKQQRSKPGGSSKWVCTGPRGRADQKDEAKRRRRSPCEYHAAQSANEGQCIAIIAADRAESSLEALRSTPGGECACFLGEIERGPMSRVLARSAFGGQGVVDMLIGDPLPRIC